MKAKSKKREYVSKKKEAVQTALFSNENDWDAEDIVFLARDEEEVKVPSYNERPGFKGAILFPHLHGLCPITESSDKIRVIVGPEKETISERKGEEESKDNLLTEERLKMIPRTAEAKKFVKNLSEILRMKLQERKSSSQIGRMFGIRSQRVTHFLYYYLDLGRERQEAREVRWKRK